MMLMSRISTNFVLVAVSLAFAVALGACGDDDSGYNSTSSPTAAAAAPTTAAAAPTPASTAASSSLTLTSDAFANDGDIPVKNSCSGDSTSPALSWTGAPAETTEFVLIVHDPDAPVAGGFAHWILTAIPAATTSLPAAVPAGATVSGGGSQPVPYRGMCPPVGAAAHHYHFRLYALDVALGDAAGATKDSVEAAMQGHILAQTDLVGLFGR